MNVIRIFLASCNDMMKYRNCATRIIEEINATIGSHFSTSIQLFRWEKEIIPGMGRPQQIIFDQSEFANIDIFVGILGNRFGTPTGGIDSNSQEYESGTQEEFEQAYKHYRETGSPEIMIFHCVTNLTPGTFDAIQYSKVQKFLSQFEASGNNPGIYCSCKSLSAFQHEFRLAVTKCILKLINQKNNTQKYVQSTADLSQGFQSVGFQKLFIPDHNNLRGIEKNNAISNSRIVYLMAKTGNSFLGSIGNRYLDLLIKNERRGYQIKILLMSPWSINAVLTALTESEDIDNYLKFLRGDIPSQRLIEAYQKTKWYTNKLMDVFQEYNNLHKQYPGIELRYLDTDFSASILITDTLMFYEPYFISCYRNRMRKKMSTFELEISRDNQLYADSLQQFHLLWDNSISYDSLIKNQDWYITHLANQIDSMNVDSVQVYIGVHVVIRKEGKILLLHRTNSKTYMPGKWDIPGGSMVAGETLEETAIREVYEETNLHIKPGRIQYAFSNRLELPSRQTIQLILDAECIEGEIKLNPKEHNDYCWASYSEALKLPLINFLVEYIHYIG